MDRQTKVDLVWIGVVALAVQAFWALRMDHPTYFDAYYYTTNAQRLAAGEGFTELVIWQYLDDPAGIPNPSFTYWMPLPAIIGAIGYKVAGTFRAAQVPFWLMAGLLPWLAYAISRRLSPEWWQARTAALFTAAGGYYTAYWVQPTTFVLFAWVGGGCLLALAWAQERNRWFYWLLAGVTAGLAHLTRADGVLLLVVAVWIWVLVIRDWRLGQVETNLKSQISNLFLLGMGYLAVMGGWFWRTWQVTGWPLSTVGTQTMFLTEYNDVFAYGRQFGPAGYLAWGWENILLSKLKAVGLAAQTFVGVTGITAFTFFVVVGWLALRRREAGRFLRPATWYTLALFGTMSLVFTFPGQRGSLLHSSTAIWPWAMALVPAGVSASVDWIAARRRSWRPRQAKRFFAAMFVLLVFVVSLVVSLRQPLQQEEAAVYEQVGEVLPAGAIVMTGDPPGVHYHTGLPTVAIPNEPPDVLLQVAQRYDVDYLLLDKDHPQLIAPLYERVESEPAIEYLRTFGDGFKLYRLHTDQVKAEE